VTDNEAFMAVAGNDTLDGGVSGNDYLQAGTGAGNRSLAVTANDVLKALSGGGNDHAVRRPGNDTLIPCAG